MEILLVILFLGLLTGLVMPRLSTLYERIVLAYEQDEVLQKIGGLGYLAFSQGLEFTLRRYPLAETDPLYPHFQLPDGWELTAEPAIEYQANGICRGGRVQVAYRRQAFELRLTPPFCVPQVL